MSLKYSQNADCIGKTNAKQNFKLPRVAANGIFRFKNTYTSSALHAASAITARARPVRRTSYFFLAVEMNLKSTSCFFFFYHRTRNRHRSIVHEERNSSIDETKGNFFRMKTFTRTQMSSSSGNVLEYDVSTAPRRVRAKINVSFILLGD